MGISTVPAFVPVDISARLAALEAADATNIFMTNAKAVLSGGGLTLCDSGYNVRWPQRFIVMGAGKSALCPDGNFSIDMPAVGTVIPRVGGGAASVTVTAAGINLDPWDTLYYILPLGGASSMVPANFRLVQYSSSFTVPATWLPICIRNSDATSMGYGGPETIRWANGMSQTPWVAPSLTGGWTTYTAPYGSQGSYRKWNGRVEMQGLLISGTVGVSAFILPVGWRPVVNLCFTSESNDVAGQVRIFTDGTVNPWTPSVAAGWISLATCGFTPTQ